MFRRLARWAHTDRGFYILIAAYAALILATWAIAWIIEL